MRSTQAKRLPSLATVVLAILLFAVVVSSQIDGAPQLGDAPTVIGATPSSSDNSNAQPTDNANNGNNANNANNGNSGNNAQDSPSPSPSPSASPSSSASSSASPSASPSSSSTQAAGVSGPIFTDAPTLQGVGVPPLIVPDLSGAPFMQKSDLPQGTVFIAVGATLGLLGAAVLAWRGLVAWSIRRSVRRAATYQYPTESKSLFGSSAAGYTSINDNPSMSYVDLAASNTAYTGNNATSKSRRSKVQSSANLFFSPTAGVGADMHSGRNSSYLPAGYYAAGSSVPGGPTGSAQVGGSNYGRLSSVGISPPDSPALNPQNRRSRASPYHSNYNSRPQSRDNLDVQPTGDRRSRLNVDSTRGPRAPSAYLDDLFESHGSNTGSYSG